MLVGMEPSPLCPILGYKLVPGSVFQLLFPRATDTLPALSPLTAAPHPQKAAGPCWRWPRPPGSSQPPSLSTFASPCSLCR